MQSGAAARQHSTHANKRMAKHSAMGIGSTVALQAFMGSPSMSASSSTHLPLPTFTSTPVGFMAAMAAAFTSLSVCGVYGVATTT